MSHNNNIPPGMILPESAARDYRVQQIILQTRLQLSSSVLGHLAGVDLSHAISVRDDAILNAYEEQEKLGHSTLPDDYEAPTLELDSDLVSGAALAYADALLIKLGLISPAQTPDQPADSSPEKNPPSPSRN